jgi:hypothetical protein
MTGPATGAPSANGVVRYVHNHGGPTCLIARAAKDLM